MGGELGADLRLRAGVLTGEAAVTLGATNQGMVAGDLVNTARRLQSVAPPGTVLVGEATYQAAADAIAFEPAGEQLLKGKTAPVPAFRALRVVAQRGGAGATSSSRRRSSGATRAAACSRTSTSPPARSGGRGWCRSSARAASARAGWSGSSRSTSTASPRSSTGTRAGPRRTARGSASGRWRRWSGPSRITEPDDPATARAKLAATLDEWVTDEAERRWIEPRLLQLLGLEAADADERPDRESLFAAWRVFFERVAERGVVVLVFEDLQWADDGLLDFIDHVLDWSRDRPIYIISLARPELLDRRTDWGAGRRNFTSLVLEPLDADVCGNCSPGWCPVCPTRSSSASWSARRASRCTRSRPSACS